MNNIQNKQCQHLTGNSHRSCSKLIPCVETSLGCVDIIFVNHDLQGYDGVTISVCFYIEKNRETCLKIQCHKLYLKMDISGNIYYVIGFMYMFIDQHL